jgi:hypothetical protein
MNFSKYETILAPLLFILITSLISFALLMGFSFPKEISLYSQIMLMAFITLGGVAFLLQMDKLLYSIAGFSGILCSVIYVTNKYFIY